MVTDSPTIAVIIVTYDSGRVLRRCLDCLQAQSRQPDLVVVVDNCSRDPSYLDEVPPKPPYRLIRLARNEGFCQGNNIGFFLARDCTYVVFLNPDAFLSDRLLEDALEWMERAHHWQVGCLTGALLGYDLDAARPSGLIDSTGIFQTRLGRWYDRGRGEPASGATGASEEVPAICGALMICRTSALEQSALRDGSVFDPSFFMYKEDIDLSLRMRALGWKLVYLPRLRCEHGRGWRGRTAVPFRARYLSARNEVRVACRYNWRTLPYSLAKLAYCITLEPIWLRIRSTMARRLTAALPTAPYGS
jgi:N-acetylglucosaminyl-diphospho-decaprenol L-rhamnosyltransferase